MELDGPTMALHVAVVSLRTIWVIVNSDSPSLLVFARCSRQNYGRTFSGLTLAWDQGMYRVILEVDIIEVYHSLQNVGRTIQCCSLVVRISDLMQRNWEVYVSHVRRDCNVG
ncbi:hypothetical protein V6N12_044917 [Hibiscus sabdariffa]|uniref:RNase H type-1 domain-containing protein n=1 Tax=Hibiscus sabdariffa TaxID=183260 RepID=A0ABR1ZAC6_9ROSI